MRPIDDSDLIKMLGWWVQGHEDEIFTGKDIEKEMMWMIRRAPNIPVQRIVHAKWGKITNDVYYCTNCFHTSARMHPMFRYYPYCGAKMDDYVV